MEKTTGQIKEELLSCLTEAANAVDRQAFLAKRMAMICEGLAGLTKEERAEATTYLAQAIQTLDPEVILGLIERHEPADPQAESDPMEEVAEKLSTETKLAVLAAVVRSQREDSNRLFSVFSRVAGAERRRRELMKAIESEVRVEEEEACGQFEGLMEAVQDLVVLEAEGRFVGPGYRSMLEDFGDEVRAPDPSPFIDGEKINRLIASISPEGIRSARDQFLKDLEALSEESDDGQKIAPDLSEGRIGLREERGREPGVNTAPEVAARSAGQVVAAHGRKEISQERGPAEEPAQAREDISSADLLQVSAEAVAGMYSEAIEGKVDLAMSKSMLSDIMDLVGSGRTNLKEIMNLKTHDDYTFTHIVNVCVLTLAQARRLNLSGELLDDIGLAALMHDVGKQRVPSEIIRKPSRLTAEEFEIMKKHTIYGAEIVRSLPGTPDLVAMVTFEHHLRYDCSGYPRIGRRRRLNLCTLLTTIADAFDAMRTLRPYSRKMSQQEVVIQMYADSGIHFERSLLEMFLRMLDPLPAGTKVRLSGGEEAVVTGRTDHDYMRPIVEIVKGPDGGELDGGRELNLADAGPAVRIAEAIPPKRQRGI